MGEIFLSYARVDKERVSPLVEALQNASFSVWWDPEVAPGAEFDTTISKALDSAKVVIVVWTPASVESRWVRGEARVGADRGILVPVRYDGAQMPIDVRAIHTIDLDDWTGRQNDPTFQQLVQRLQVMINPTEEDKAAGLAPSEPKAPATSICVLPFVNMSGEAEQEYFSDGISEDIITDLSKVSALSVTARNTAFTYKGKSVSIPQVARQLNVSHVLEGSVRKAGNRVRITAQLIDGMTGNHIWAERFDREMSDIFDLQDEISEAIVEALRVRLMPEEKKAIENRGTNDVEAYNLYLMARQYSVTGNFGNAQRNETIVRLCQRAIDIDPNYAKAWALMASAQLSLRLHLRREGDGGLAAAERALELDQNLAEAHSAKATVLFSRGDYDGAIAEIDIALRLDPDSYEVHVAAARWNYAQHRIEEAIRHFEKAVSLMENDYWAAGMLLACFRTINDTERARIAAGITLERVEKAVAQDPGSGSAMSFGVAALVTLDQTDRALEWAERARLLDPDNLNMLYNIGCALIAINQFDAAMDMLEPGFQKLGIEALNWSKADPDLDPIRDHPRFIAMMEAQEKRLAEQAKSG
jgi:adenylate cyclase